MDKPKISTPAVAAPVATAPTTAVTSLIKRSRAADKSVAASVKAPTDTPSYGGRRTLLGTGIR